VKILVISDTHNNLKNANIIIDKIKDKINLIIHLGDNIEDARILENKYDIDFEYIAGNCDCNYDFSENCKIIKYNNKNIFITHGHRYNVKYELDTLYDKAVKKKADIVLFGHTHEPSIEYIYDILFLNPGSLSLPRGKYECTYGVIDISENGVIEPSIMEIKNKDKINLIIF